MFSDDEVEVVVSWEALLKRSLVYESARDIFSGKAHKDPSLGRQAYCAAEYCQPAMGGLTPPWLQPGGRFHEAQEAIVGDLYGIIGNRIAKAVMYSLPLAARSSRRPPRGDLPPG
jgi:hypothetical protein